MNEEQWNGCTEPGEMLAYLRDGGKTSDRKLRLFACACCWRVHAHDPEGDIHPAVLVGEGMADGRLGWRQLRAAQRRVEVVQSFEARAYALLAVSASVHRDATLAAEWAASHAECYFGQSAWDLPVQDAGWEDIYTAGCLREVVAQAGLLRDIFGNPFRPLSPLSPSLLAWSDGIVVSLAVAAYEERSLPSGHLDPARLAVLGDALEDAGCTDAQLLAHLRSQGPHVRGCFVVDAVLGKS